MLTLSGVAIGLAAALMLTQVAAGLLFGVSATDPLTFVAISALLTGVASGSQFHPGSPCHESGSDGRAAL